MQPPDLRRHYLAYLATLDERRFDDLPTYVADELVYNQAFMTGAQYREARADDVRVLPDLSFDVQQLVVSDDHVACRLRFACTPVEPFRGFAPTGQEVVFDEHVFYRFHDGRIVQVWSLLDVEALERQLPRQEP